MPPSRISDRFQADVTTPDPVSVKDMAEVLHFTREHWPTREASCPRCRDDAFQMVEMLRHRRVFEGRRSA